MTKGQFDIVNRFQVSLEEAIRKKLAEGTLLIAGPCSAESRKQLLLTAEGLRGIRGVCLFRAGVWKPRTWPGQFEGHGEGALPWLAEVQETTGIPVCCEVGTASQARKAWEWGVRVIWIGARTSGDPYAVDAISLVAAKYNLVVFVKNPACPDLSLWLGALERLKRAGCRLVIPVHRGFSTHESPAPYRNAPLWDIPQKLRAKMPELPLVCDPSHIAGDAALIRQVCRNATLLGFRGLMVEVHHRPEEALTDARQQITPARLAEILGDISWFREPAPEDTRAVCEG